MSRNQKKQYTVYFKDSRSIVIEGDNIGEAWHKSGYGVKELPEVDFTTEGDSRARWHFDTVAKAWGPLFLQEPITQ